MANQKSSKKVAANFKVEDYGAHIQAFRTQLGMNQRDFARFLGVTQSAVGQWETGKTKPSPMAFMAIGKMGGADKDLWFRLAGQEYARTQKTVDAYRKSYEIREDESRIIPIHGSAGAGPNRFTSESLQWNIALPRVWFREEQRVVGVRVVGDSMAPLIRDGSYVFLDPHDNKDLQSLENKVVAARNDDGVVIKWLKKRGKDYYLLSQNPDLAYPPIEVQKNDYAIVGRVLRWVGDIPQQEL